VGGAQLDHEQAAANLKTALLTNLELLCQKPKDCLLSERYEKFRQMGQVLEG
jgi:acetyl-CoA carboxylase alpha subunit